MRDRRVGGPRKRAVHGENRVAKRPSDRPDVRQARHETNAQHAARCTQIHLLDNEPITHITKGPKDECQTRREEEEKQKQRIKARI